MNIAISDAKNDRIRMITEGRSFGLIPMDSREGDVVALADVSQSYSDQKLSTLLLWGMHTCTVALMEKLCQMLMS